MNYKSETAKIKELNAEIESKERQIKDLQNKLHAERMKNHKGKIFYGNEKYVADNGQGYDYDSRDCFCSACGNLLYREVHYRGINETYYSENQDSDNWKFCHYCGVSIK